MPGGHKYDPAHRAHLDSPERQAYLDPAAILTSFGIRRGWRIADVGAGIGFFSLPAAEMVGPRGHVFAVDLSAEMLEDLEDRIKKDRLTNIQPLLSSEDRVPVADATVDFAFLACVLHELEGPATLHECRRIMKPSGRLGIVDWKKIDQDEGPPKEHRLDEGEATAVLRDAGFRPLRTFDAGLYHYAIEARIANE